MFKFQLKFQVSFIKWKLYGHQEHFSYNTDTHSYISIHIRLMFCVWTDHITRTESIDSRDTSNDYSQVVKGPWRRKEHPYDDVGPPSVPIRRYRNSDIYEIMNVHKPREDVEKAQEEESI